MPHESVSAYPSPEQASRWRTRAEEMDMGMSEFVSSMVEAGLKGFDAYHPADASVDTTADDLHEQLADQRAENDRLTAKVRNLQDRLTGTDAGAVLRIVWDTPGAAYGDVLGRVRATTPERMDRHLTAFDGDLIRGEVDPDDDTERFYPAPEVTREQLEAWGLPAPRGARAEGRR